MRGLISKLKKINEAELLQALNGEIDSPFQIKEII